ncbi:Ubiquitin-conjugating enzyme E2 J1 [Porphyridium purpureum]|uniref:Ubiquitin-conjugating enzyme E2 J1 n=1 Tax=Porphyridium purpureum TaxID=35688 RepID=A0A5J4Z378_PORPP|nr:Ubiquitin-conjugating enzyme E2 J1 [Porphyridium purpureum]|eukprot:POR0839..scf295_1
MSRSLQNAAVKRIMLEVKELQREAQLPGSFFHASPLENDLFEWHFTVKGPPDTAFQGGLYHGRIILPAEYPMKAPEIVLLTPNGRFEVGTRICLSITSHHQETWQPSWGIRTILTALIGFMPSKAEGLGSLNFPAEDRRALAAKSIAFQCPICGCKVKELFEDAPAASCTAAGAVHENGGKEAAESASGTRDSKAAAAAPSDAEPSQPATIRDDASSTAPESASLNARPNQPGVAEVQRHSMNHAEPVLAQATNDSEKELKYAAYAVLFFIVAIIVRRVLKIVEIDTLL